MRTAQQWFALDNLPTELGRVFTPGRQYHTWPEYQRYGAITCSKCGLKWNQHTAHSPCPVPDPIDIKDWNTAMEHFRQYAAICFGLVRQQPLIPAMEDIYRHYNEVGSEIDREELFYWFLFKAPTEALLVAAAMAKERSKE